MLEYGIEDAKVLLEKNLEAANKSLSQVEDDLSFIRDQTTTLEVSILLQSSRQQKKPFIIFIKFVLELSAL